MTALIPTASKALPITSSPAGLRLYSQAELRTWAKALQIGDSVQVIDKRKPSVAQAANELARQGNITTTDAEIELHRMCAWEDCGVEQITGFQQIYTWSQCAEIANGTVFRTNWTNAIHEAKGTPYSTRAQIVPLDHDFERQMQLMELAAYVGRAARFAAKGKALSPLAFSVMREAVEQIERLS